MLSDIFRSHALFCVHYSWEVIFLLFTVSLCLIPSNSTFSFWGSADLQPPQPWSRNVPIGYRGLDAVLMSLIRCTAILNGYQQWKVLKKISGRYIIALVLLFTVVSSVVFSTATWSFFQPNDLGDFRDALFLFLLFMDVSKAIVFTEYALMAQDQDSLRQSVSDGLSVLGPSMALDTIVETLVVGVGTLSGIRRLEVICNCACLGVLIRFLTFITFLPSSLSLFTELGEIHGQMPRSLEELRKIRKTFLLEDSDLHTDGGASSKLLVNPVARRLKVIMSFGLAVIHVVCRCYRWMNPVALADPVGTFPASESVMNKKFSEETGNEFLLWLSSHAQSLVLFIIFASLLYKHLLEKREAEEMLSDASDSSTRLSSVKDHPNIEVGMKQKLVSTGSQVELVSDVPRNRRTDISVPDRGNPVLGSACQVRKRQRTRSDSEGSIIAIMSLSSSDEDSDDGGSKTVSENESESEGKSPRSLEECLAILSEPRGPQTLSDEEVLLLVNAKKIPPYKLETALGDAKRGVHLRRQLLIGQYHHKIPTVSSIASVPFRSFDYSAILGACCENVVGHISLPVGLAGPLLLDGREVFIPMATTEGCLVASTNRGCRALSADGTGVATTVLSDGMTRGPVLRFCSAARAAECLRWVQDPENFLLLKACFDGTSRFARLTKIKGMVAGRLLFLRFVARTGDAMGMNMVSKAVETILNPASLLSQAFPDVELISLSGNVCCDKKSSAINWIEGRGKSVVAEAVVSASVLEKILKTTAKKLTEVNISKNLIGSAVSGSIGGFNAHAANIVAAIFIATGQDPAQVVESASCITVIEETENEGIRISVTMPSLEVGTVGGGTFLQGQAACLSLLGVCGPHSLLPGANATQLAQVVAGAVLAGELNVLAALAEGHLVQAHLAHNRSSVALVSTHHSIM